MRCVTWKKGSSFCMRGKGRLVKTVVAETCFSGEILPGTVSKLHEKHWGCRCEGMAFLSCSFPQHRRQSNRSVLPPPWPRKTLHVSQKQASILYGHQHRDTSVPLPDETKGSLKPRYSWMSYKHSHFTWPWGMTHLKHPCSTFFEEQGIHKHSEICLHFPE